MQVLTTYILIILGLFSPCLCQTLNLLGTNTNVFNVIDYGARGDGKSDDTQAFLRAWSGACGARGPSILHIPPKRLYLLNNIKFIGPCKASSILIRLKGKIIAPLKGALRDSSHWIRIEYVNRLTVSGLKSGRIDGNGASWWQCPNCQRPVVLYFHACNNLNVNNLRIVNSPLAHMGISGCNNGKFSKIYIQSPDESPNTDGIDIATSKNIWIYDSIIHSGDDCIAVNTGSSFINVTNVDCGPGHGISIGSLGRGNSNEKVEEVTVRNCRFFGTTNGARIKTVPGGSGYARKITFEEIQLSNVRNPIIIDQHYNDPGFETGSAVQVSDVKFRGFNGTSASEIAIKLDCISCQNVELDNVYIFPSHPIKEVRAICSKFNGRIGSTSPRVICQ